MRIAKIKVVAALMLVVLVTAAGAEEVARGAVAAARANLILDKSIAESGGIDSYSTDLETTVEFVHRPAAEASDVVRETSAMKIRVDGRRSDVTDENEYFRSGRPKPQPQYKGRVISDAQGQLSRQEYQGADPRQVEAAISSRVQDFRLSYNCAPFLDGIAEGDTTTMTRVVRDSGTAKLRADPEPVAGHPCQVIEAKTPRGNYTLWIDPDAGYQLRRALVIKRPGDLMFEKKLASDGTAFTQRGLELDIHDILIERIGGRYIPMKAVMECKSIVGGGEFQQTHQIATRSHFRIKPDFKVIGAFMMDGIPEGTPVAVLDEDGPLKGAKAVWHHGEVAISGLAPPRLDPGRRPGVGDPAFDIEGKDMNGNPLKLKDYRGKVVVLVFWATWCGPCMSMVPHERALVRWMKDKPFALIGINGDRNTDHARAVMKKEEMTWPCWFDGGDNGPIGQQWDVHGWPTIYVIDGDGVIRYEDVRFEELDKAVRTLVKQTQKLKLD